MPTLARRPGETGPETGQSGPAALRILHLEDDPQDVRLIREILKEAGIVAELAAVSNRADFAAALEREGFDLVLADYRLPTFDGLEALDLARTRRPEVPVVFVTGAMGEERAIETLRAGAVDYVLKDNLRRLPAAVRRAVSECQDRAHRRRAEEEVARQKLAFQRLAENSPDIIVRFDARLRCLYVNPAIERVTGLPWTSFLEKTAAELGPPGRFCALWQGGVERVFATGEPGRLECDFPEGSEEVRHYHVIVTPEFGPDGRVETALSVARDMTESKQAAEALRRANLALAEADRQKDEFLAMLAHELRNPLAPIRFAVQILRIPGAGPTDLQRQTDVIDRQVTHMARLLEDLLDVSRITRGEVSLQKVPLELREVVGQALEAYRPILIEQGIKLHYQPAEEPLRLEGDATRLDQVVRNVLANAVKFTPGGGRIWVSLVWKPGTGDEAPQGIVRIRDTGAGIAPEMLPKIFDLFVQGDQAADRARTGLGIGLTVVKRLVEMHGGGVRARSDGPGLGSEFTILLPLSETPCVEGREAPDRGRDASFARPGPARRVLIVEDNVDAALSLAELLRIWGAETVVVHNGTAALELPEATEFDLILLDLGLPDMDGFEVARRLRASRRPGALFVAMTGYGQEEYRVRSEEAGFDRHLTKPVDTAVLRELLEAAGDQREARITSPSLRIPS